MNNPSKDLILISTQFIYNELLIETRYLILICAEYLKAHLLNVYTFSEMKFKEYCLSLGDMSHLKYIVMLMCRSFFNHAAKKDAKLLFGFKMTLGLNQVLAKGFQFEERRQRIGIVRFFYLTYEVW